MIEHVNLNNVLDTMPNDAVLSVFTSSGPLPVSVQTYRNHHTVTTDVTVGIGYQTILFYTTNNLFYMTMTQDEIYRFLCKQSGKTLIY